MAGPLQEAAVFSREFSVDLLSRGDRAVLIAPVTDFYAEVRRRNPVRCPFRAMQPENPNDPASYATQSVAAEALDLASELRRQKVPAEESLRIRAEHGEARQKLRKYGSDMAAWADSRPVIYDENGSHIGEAQVPKPEFPDVTVPEELPKEFGLYLEGSIGAARDGETNSAAIDRFKQILMLPPPERHWKSTWAAYKLGKSYEMSDPPEAIRYFRQVRELARQGFEDSIGLAAASLGREARVWLNQRNFAVATDLYLEQMATGDDTAGDSLRITASRALETGTPALRQMAATANGQRVLTAYLISRFGARNGDETTGGCCKSWLEAVSASEVTNAVSADELALAAFQSGDTEFAERWIARAGNSMFAKWLEAKLMARRGELDKAVNLLQTVSHAVPMGANFGESGDSFISDVFVNDEWGQEECPISRHILGELGVVQLARGEYVTSLDAFLRAGYWGDAAYAAERVMTLDELKSYVDTMWPDLPDPAPPQLESVDVSTNSEAIDYSFSARLKRETADTALAKNIRYLLARRLTRSLRGEEARPYYPAEYLEKFDALAKALRAGWDSNSPTNEQANNLFDAAVIVRTDGMELLGTELAPDYHISGGGTEYGVKWQDRPSTNPEFKVLAASSDEISRAMRHHADPEQRFHYRYQAAFLGWEAAKHMPNNSDETARVLAMSGSWLKGRDADTADLFYKALVRRNRLTPVGCEADRRRWFPDIDAEGNLYAQKPETADQAEPQANGDSATEPKAVDSAPAVQSSADPLQLQQPHGDFASTETEPEPESLTYVVQPGDTMASICRMCAGQGLSVSIEQLVEANGGIDPRTIKIGQELVIPPQ